MSKRSVTKDHQIAGDLSFSFRAQDPRTLAEIDTLIKRQAKLRELLGDQLASQIEKEPDLFYNHERFRIWQAKARFRAFVATIPTVMVVSNILNGNKGGIDLLKKRYGLALPAVAFTYATYFFIFHRQVGYNNQVYNEQAYAKNHKMLRNLIIRQ